MKKIKNILIFLLFYISMPFHAQEDEFDKLLGGVVDNVNLVYKPVIGFGIGIMNYFGDVKNNFLSPTIGSPGIKINLATYVDNTHYIRANFNFLYGQLTGNERSYKELRRNYNFKSDLYVFGFDLNYDFDNFFTNNYSLVQPFISIGIETVLFSTYTDTCRKYDNSNEYFSYDYLPDGTIRDPYGRLTERDYEYETPVNNLGWANNEPAPYAFAIPVDIGLDMHMSERLTLRAATTFHFTFSDQIDNVSHKNTSGIIGDKLPDFFNYTYISMHLDLFSSKKTIKWGAFFRDLTDVYDYTFLYDDEDLDGISDGWDNCLGTPRSAEIDSFGCPIDSDIDGIPDYRDDEIATRKGAFVDDRGVEITEDDLITLLDKSMAVGRNEIDLYIRKPDSYIDKQRKNKVNIPEKFKSIDLDKDGYISFDEMLETIDDFFDFKSGFSPEDIYELNSFFFSQ